MQGCNGIQSGYKEPIEVLFPNNYISKKYCTRDQVHSSGLNTDSTVETYEKFGDATDIQRL